MKTNRTLKLITLTAAIFGFAATSFGQITATDGAAHAFATIIRPITLASEDDLEFGIITASTDGGTVTVPPTGTVTTSGVTLYDDSQQPASYDVSGEAGYTYSITLPASVTLSNNTGATMNVTGFKTNSGTETEEPAGSTGNSFDANGDATFYVGATLNIGAAQTSGEYTGTFSVTVAYE